MFKENEDDVLFLIRTVKVHYDDTHCSIRVLLKGLEFSISSLMYYFPRIKIFERMLALAVL